MMICINFHVTKVWHILQNIPVAVATHGGVDTAVPTRQCQRGGVNVAVSTQQYQRGGVNVAVSTQANKTPLGTLAHGNTVNYIE